MERYWLVWVGDTPVNPQEPLGYEDAMAEFVNQVELGEDDEKVEIRQCSATELEWAGVARRRPAPRVVNKVTGPVTGISIQCAGDIHGGVRF